MTLFFPLPPHLQLPTSLFSHTAGSSVSKQSQETQSGVLSLLLTFKHLNSSRICLLMSVIVLSFVTLLSHCVNWMLPGHALLSAVHRATSPCASVQFSHSVVSNSLLPHEPQHTRPPCPSPTPRVYPNSCPLSRCCHPSHPLSSPSPPAFSLSQYQGLFK